MTDIGECKDYRNISVHVNEPRLALKLHSELFKYVHLRNLVILLTRQSRADHSANPESTPDRSAELRNPEIMRALLCGQPGGRHKERVDELRKVYAYDKMMQEAIALGQKLSPKLVFELLKQISQNWKSFFALQKLDHQKAGQPRTTSLRSVQSFSLPIDMECVSFKRRNKARLLLYCPTLKWRF